MNNRVAVLFLLGTVLVSGCNNQPVMDYGKLLDGLREAGATVEPIGNTPFPGDDPQQPIFSGTGKRIEVNSENVSLLEYDDETMVEAEAKFISPDGFTYTSENWTMIANISWVAPPHFYKAGKIIVLYIGTNQAIIDLLENLLGPPFAGWGSGTD
jgi:hypothetical protein